MADLEKEVAELKKSVAAQAEKIAKQDSLISKLQAQVANLAKASAKAPEAKTASIAPAKEEAPTVPAKSYKSSTGLEVKFTVASFLHNGQKLTAAAALEDDALMEELIAKTGSDIHVPGAGILQSVAK